MLESLINQDFWVTLAGAAAVLLQFVLTASVILRVILTRHPPGSSFAWILLVTILPYIGFILYVWLGERPIGRWRALRLRHLLKHWEEVTDEGYAISGTLPTMPHGQRHKGLTRLAERLGDLIDPHGTDAVAGDELLRRADDLFLGRSPFHYFSSWLVRSRPPPRA